MPDTYVVNSQGKVVEWSRDRAASFQRMYGFGHYPVGVVYMGDPHDVQAPARINPVARAARARRQAWRDSFDLCINCRLAESQHGGWSDDEYGWEPINESACGDYTRPAPLALIG